MVEFYVNMIKNDEYCIDDVLEPWRAAVEEALMKR